MWQHSQSYLTHGALIQPNPIINIEFSLKTNVAMTQHAFTQPNQIINTWRNNEVTFRNNAFLNSDIYKCGL